MQATYSALHGRLRAKPVLSWLRRRWLFLAAAFGFGALVLLQSRELRTLGYTLVEGQWAWLLAAGLWQLVYYLGYAVQYQQGFATVGVEGRAIQLVPVVFASIFLKTVVPSGGVSSLAVFIDDATRRGRSAARAAEGALLVLVAGLARRGPVLPAGWGERQAVDFVRAARDIVEHPRALGGTLAIALALKLANLASLYAVSLAYRHPLACGPLVAALAMGVVFSVVNLIPHGLGMAEGIMALVLTSLGVAAAEALTIAIVFRGLSVWLPLLVGFLCLRQVGSFANGEG